MGDGTIAANGQDTSDAGGQQSVVSRSQPGADTGGQEGGAAADGQQSVAGAGEAGIAGDDQTPGGLPAGTRKHGKRGVRGTGAMAGGSSGDAAADGDGDESSGAEGMTVGSADEGTSEADADSRTHLASISAPNNGVAVDEDRLPQTLGGTLPLAIGVNEEGRFDFDEYALRPEVQHILDDLAAKLQGAEYDRLDIVGYTDRIGTADYNRRLSELRAYAVTRYLVQKGVPENKIHYEGRGSSNPMTSADSCSGLARPDLIVCLQKDRRVEIEASIHRKHATVLQ